MNLEKRRALYESEERAARSKGQFDRAVRSQQCAALCAAGIHPLDQTYSWYHHGHERVNLDSYSIVENFLLFEHVPGTTLLFSRDNAMRLMALLRDFLERTRHEYVHDLYLGIAPSDG